MKEHENFPCFPCKNKEDCFRAEKRARKVELRLKELSKNINQIEHYYWNEFIKLRNILDSLGYLKNNIPTEKGIMAASLRGENIVLISEVILNTDFSKLSSAEFAAIVSSLATDESRPRTYTKARHSYHVDDVFMSVQKTTRNLIKLQRDNGIEVSVNVNPLLAGLIQLWCKEETQWEDLLRSTNLDEGDIVRASRRTMDLLRHIKNAPYMDSKIIKLAKEALELMDKEPVKEVV